MPTRVRDARLNVSVSYLRPVSDFGEDTIAVAVKTVVLALCVASLDGHRRPSDLVCRQWEDEPL